MHFAPPPPQAMRSIAGGVGEQCSPTKKPKSGALRGRRLRPRTGGRRVLPLCGNSGAGGDRPLKKRRRAYM